MTGYGPMKEGVDLNPVVIYYTGRGPHSSRDPFTGREFNIRAVPGAEFVPTDQISKGFAGILIRSFPKKFGWGPPTVPGAPPEMSRAEAARVVAEAMERTQAAADTTNALAAAGLGAAPAATIAATAANGAIVDRIKLVALKRWARRLGIRWKRTWSKQDHVLAIIDMMAVTDPATVIVEAADAAADEPAAAAPTTE